MVTAVDTGASFKVVKEAALVSNWPSIPFQEKGCAVRSSAMQTHHAVVRRMGLGLWWELGAETGGE